MINFDIKINLDGLAQNVAEFADTVQRRAAMELQSELIETTPRDTSRARSGWHLDTNHGTFVPPKGLESYKPQKQVAPKGAPFLIVYNNVEYIVPLNEGHSQQEAPGFVQRAKDKVQRGFK